MCPALWRVLAAAAVLVLLQHAHTHPACGCMKKTPSCFLANFLDILRILPKKSFHFEIQDSGLLIL